MSDLNRLRTIAERPSPGAWYSQSEASDWTHNGNETTSTPEADAEFIVTFDPTTVLALLDVAEAAGAFERISVEEWEYGVATKADADWWDDWDERRESQLEALSIALDRLREVT